MSASTTPVPDDPPKKQAAASSVERNLATVKLTTKRGITDDLLAPIAPCLPEMQNPNVVHFNAKSDGLLGAKVAASSETVLKPQRT